MLYNKAIIPNNYYVKYVKDSNINSQKMTATYIIFTKTKVHKYIIQNETLTNIDLSQFINQSKTIINIKKWKIINNTNNKVSSNFFIIYPINEISFIQMDLLLYFGKIEWCKNLCNLIEISSCSICTYINFYTSTKYYNLVKYFNCYSNNLFRLNDSLNINKLQSDLITINISKNDFKEICNQFKQRLYNYFKSITIINPQLASK